MPDATQGLAQTPVDADKARAYLQSPHAPTTADEREQLGRELSERAESLQSRITTLEKRRAQALDAWSTEQMHLQSMLEAIGQALSTLSASHHDEQAEPEPFR